MEISQSGLSIPFVATSNLSGQLKDYHGQWLVLYFYPKDATPGCTKQAEDFCAHYTDFNQLGVRVLGVSRDSLTAHERFKAKHQLPFELISDSDERLCQAFGVIKNKSMYGKVVRGVERSTFIIDPQGHIIKEWRKVKVAEHVKEVLAFLREVCALGAST